MRTRATAPLLAVSLTALGACSSGPEGTYILDRQATEEGLRAERPGASFSLSDTDLTVVLAKGGTFERTITFQGYGPSGPVKQEQEESGTWTAEGSNVELKTPNGHVSCTAQESRLTCKSDPFVESITGGMGSRVYLGVKGTVKR